MTKLWARRLRMLAIWIVACAATNLLVTDSNFANMLLQGLLGVMVGWTLGSLEIAEFELELRKRHD